MSKRGQQALFTWPMRKRTRSHFRTHFHVMHLIDHLFTRILPLSCVTNNWNSDLRTWKGTDTFNLTLTPKNLKLLLDHVFVMKHCFWGDTHFFPIKKLNPIFLLITLQTITQVAEIITSNLPQ